MPTGQNEPACLLTALAGGRACPAAAALMRPAACCSLFFKADSQAAQPVQAGQPGRPPFAKHAWVVPSLLVDGINIRRWSSFNIGRQLRSARSGLRPHSLLRRGAHGTIHGIEAKREREGCGAAATELLVASILASGRPSRARRTNHHNVAHQLLLLLLLLLRATHKLRLGGRMI